MEEIGMFEAKTNLSSIADRVRSTGQPVTLTKRGKPYVDLVPHGQVAGKRSWAELSAEVKELQKDLPKFTAAENKAAIEEGRR